MLWWALLFLIIALIAAFFGYRHLAYTSTQIAYWCIIIFFVLLIVAFTIKLIQFGQ